MSDPNLTLLELDDNAVEQLTTRPEAVVLPGFQCMGLMPEPRWSTRHALLWLSAAGYDLDVRGLTHLIFSEQFAAPEKVGGVFSWAAADIGRLAALLHSKRRFMVGRHMDRKTPGEKQRDLAAAESGLSVLRFYETMSAAELEQRLSEATESPARELLLRALKQKRSAAAAGSANN